jgi:hypothetical protein
VWAGLPRNMFWADAAGSNAAASARSRDARFIIVVRKLERIRWASAAAVCNVIRYKRSKATAGIARLNTGPAPNPSR